MAELLQLDAAAALVGKSEVTLRRLIKAGRIPVHKEKTLTGFIYLVDADEVRAYYQMRGDLPDSEEGAQTVPAQSAPTSNQVAVRRLAIAGESGDVSEYWQKRAESYEDRYHHEVQKHAQAREELGVWRGRAEQAQAMLMKMLPAPTEITAESATQTEVAPTPQKESNAFSGIIMFLTIIVTLCFVALVAGAGYYLFYLR